MVKIITDDGADIPKHYIDKYDIEILHMAINDGENEYYNDVNITKEEVYDGMRKGKVYKTAQVTMTDLVDCFTKYAKSDDEAIYFTLSSGISGTYSSALIARDTVIGDYPDAKIYVVDTVCASFGQGMLVVKASMMAKDGLSAKEIIEKSNIIKLNHEALYSVGDLEYLFRGGRVSRTSKVLGGLLNIKPILSLSKEDGKLNAIDKARGTKTLYKKLFDHMNELSSGGKFNPEQTIAICHGDWLEEAEKLKNVLKDEFDIKEENIMMSFIGTVIGAHTGPDIICIFFNSDPQGEYDFIN
ncbi:MAG: DegV family protein [Tissierellia bacterium]|nr:DegV family protein [Tissierellia bacterium]